MDMHLLLMSLEAIERVCTHKKAKSKPSKKASHKGKKGKKCSGTKSRVRVPKKVHFEKYCNLCKRHGGAYATHNAHDCCRFEKDRKEKSNFFATKKGSKKANPINQNYCVSEKIEKLKKVLKKLGKKA